MPFKITSPDFSENEEIPRDYTGEGKDISPTLQWSNVPEGTQEFALICEDPDAPGAEQPFVHWAIYDISPSMTRLPAGMPAQKRLDLPVRADQGTNSFGNIGYGGPMPPQGHGWHRYFFKLYALNQELGVLPGATREELLKAMQGHVLAEASLMGRYQRVADAKRRKHA